MAFPVLFHVNAISLLDEGVEPVLTLAQREAAATGLLLAVHGFNPEVVDRGTTWPGHGPQGSHGSLGGTFTEIDPAHFARGGLGPSRVAETPLSTFDALREIGAPARRMGLDLHLYILESAGTGGYQRNVPGWPRVLEVDRRGIRGGLPCVNHPDYRAWKLALIEGLYKTHDFDGLLWGVERWGPLHQALAGAAPRCFCAHCAGVAEQAGLDWGRVAAGYARLHELASSTAADDPNRFVRFLRLLLEHPEILGWEGAWTRAYLSLHRELYGVAHWLAPERKFGLGLWHYYFINPLLRAEWDMREFAASCDYIRPILYHLPEGPRIARYVGLLQGSVAAGPEAAALWSVLGGLLGLTLPPLQDFARKGLPGDYVGQGVRIVREASGGARPIYAGIGIDVFEHGLEAPMQPADVESAVAAALAAGADGITVSRNYAEMRHENIAAVGRALRRRAG